jgi:hypothetical protein
MPNGLSCSLSAFVEPYRPAVETPETKASQTERFLSFRNSLCVIDVFASCRGERIHRSVKLAQ